MRQGMWSELEIHKNCKQHYHPSLSLNTFRERRAKNIQFSWNVGQILDLMKTIKGKLVLGSYILYHPIDTKLSVHSIRKPSRQAGKSTEMGILKFNSKISLPPWKIGGVDGLKLMLRDP